MPIDHDPIDHDLIDHDLIDHDLATAPLERHLLPRTAEVDGSGRLQVGGVDLLGAAREFGTPLFVYDEEHLRHACRDAVAAWGEGVAYATKAFLCRAMARLAHEEGMHLDVASGGELHVALSAGVPAERLVLHGNNKSSGELAMALEAGVGRIVVDSFDEIARLGGLLESAPRRPVRPKVLVRVTPGVEAHTHEFVRTGQEDTKFGFSVSSGAAAQAVAALELLPAVEMVGIHAHIGSQVFEASSFEQAAEVLGAFFAPLDLPELVVGGGLGVPYLNGESAPSQAEWAEATLSGAESGLVTRARHRAALMDAVAALDRAQILGAEGPDELLAEELRLAARALARLTGRIDVEDLLDVIFREFCVGK